MVRTPEDAVPWLKPGEGLSEHRLIRRPEPHLPWTVTQDVDEDAIFAVVFDIADAHPPDVDGVETSPKAEGDAHLQLPPNRWVAFQVDPAVNPRDFAGVGRTS